MCVCRSIGLYIFGGIYLYVHGDVDAFVLRKINSILMKKLTSPKFSNFFFALIENNLNKKLDTLSAMKLTLWCITILKMGPHVPLVRETENLGESSSVHDHWHSQVDTVLCSTSWVPPLQWSAPTNAFHWSIF